jgi:Arc/MetJ family transcription regulator
METLLERRASGASLRELRDYYNDEVIAATLEAADGSVLTDVETVRAALRGEIESAGDRIEIEHELGRMGVDVEELESRLVSHETLRQYLDERDVEPETEPDAVTVEEVRDTVAWATSREEAIIERKLEQLARTDILEFRDIDIDTAITVTCSDTGVAYPLEEFIERGGCPERPKNK